MIASDKSKIKNSLITKSMMQGENKRTIEETEDELPVSDKRTTDPEGVRKKKKIAVPGGEAIVNERSVKSKTGVLEPELTYFIRSYFDILFNSTTQSKLILLSRNIEQSEYAIPNIVANILQYNNIVFSKVTMSSSSIALPEPVWYDIDLPNSHLHLYLYSPMYDEFCVKLSDNPVIMASGIIPIENYNPIDVHPQLRDIDTATINCSIVCDHVAQHIISDIFNPLKPDGADIHAKYNEHGTTLHSIFDITAFGTEMDNKNCTNCFTLFNTSGKKLAVDSVLDNLMPQTLSFDKN
ncbi:GbNV_gp13-like [Fopius arisanus]|nr:GbNV_gp13-like [Fopius arisanus]